MNHPVKNSSNLQIEEAEEETTAEIHPLVVRRWAVTADGSLRRTHSCSHLLAA